MAKKITQTHMEFIAENYLIMSDSKIGKYISLDYRTVRKYRHQQGLLREIEKAKIEIKNQALNKEPEQETSKKPKKKPEVKLAPKPEITIKNTAPVDERQQFFVNQLQNRLYYEELKRQFAESEILFYLEEWGALCVQFEDVVATESRQIHDLIVNTILGNRILKHIKTTEDEIGVLHKEIIKLRNEHDLDDDEEAQERDELMLNLMRRMGGQCNAMEKSYNAKQKIQNDILKELNARRQDRLEEIRHGGQDFATIVKKYNDVHVQKQQGRMAELIRLAEQKQSNEWRKPARFPDGKEDCILMDEHSEVPKQEIVYLEKKKKKDKKDAKNDSTSRKN